MRAGFRKNGAANIPSPSIYLLTGKETEICTTENEFFADFLQKELALTTEVETGRSYGERQFHTELQLVTAKRSENERRGEGVG